MDFGFIVNDVLVPLATAVIAIVATVAVPVFVKRAIAYSNRKFKLDIDEAESYAIQRIADDAIRAAEQLLPGKDRGREKFIAARSKVLAATASVGIDIANDHIGGAIEHAVSSFNRWNTEKKADDA